MSNYIAIVKAGYVPLALSDDEVIPGNIGALRLGLEALTKEDAQDYARAEQLWEQAKQLLANEVHDETGAGAQGAVQVEDTFQMERVGNPRCYEYFGGY